MTTLIKSVRLEDYAYRVYDEAQAGLGYHQMNLYVPVKLKENK